VTSTLQVSWVEPPQGASASHGTTLSLFRAGNRFLTSIDCVDAGDFVNIGVDGTDREAARVAVDDGGLSADLTHAADWAREVDLIDGMPSPLRADGAT
jgi:hypothetical protein